MLYLKYSFYFILLLCCKIFHKYVLFKNQLMQSNTVSNANRTINAANNQQVVINSNGATFDIIREIIEVDKTAYKDTLRFAPQLKGYNLKDTCKNIWEFVHNNITYKEDPNGYQFIKTPASLWSTKTGDCKSFAIFVGSILKNLNIPYLYRFVSFDNGNYTHVYIVVPTGQQEIIIDTTIKYFNTETQFKTKKEIPMTKIIKVSGVGAAVKVPISKFRIDETVDYRNIYNTIFNDQSKTFNKNTLVKLTNNQLQKIFKDAINYGNLILHDNSIGLPGWLKKLFKTLGNLAWKLVCSYAINKTGIPSSYGNQIINVIPPLINATYHHSDDTGIYLNLNSTQVALLQNSNISDDNYKT